MKTLFKILGIIIIILIAAILLLPVIFKGKITELAKEEINKNVNAEVNFTGINLSLIRSFPNFSLGIEGLSIAGKDPFVGDTLANIESIEITLDLMSVINGDSYEVKRIMVNQPQVLVKILEDGRANYDIAPESEDDPVDVADESGSDSYKLTLKHFEVQGGRLIYDDAELGMIVELNGLNHKLSGDLTADKTTLKTNTTVDDLELIYEGVRYFSNTQVVYDADIEADLKNEIYTLSNNTLELNELEIAFAGSVSMVNEDINLVITFEAPKTDFKHLLSMVPAIYARDFENIETSGQLSLEGHVKGIYNDDQIPSFGIDLAVNDARFKYPDLPAAVTDVNILASINNKGGDVDNTVVNIPEFHMQLGENPVDITLQVKTPVSDPEIDGTIKGELDLGKVKDYYPLEEGEELTGTIIADVRLQGKMSSIENEQYADFTAIGSMLVKNFAYQNTYLNEQVTINNAQLNFSPSYLNLVSFDSKIGRNDLKAEGKIENYLGYALSDGTLNGTLTISSGYFNVSDLMPAEDIEQKGEEETLADTSSMSVVEIPANINFEMKTTLDKLIYDNIEMTNVGGKVIIRESQIILENLSMNVLDGEMSMSGKYATQSKLPEVDFRLKMANIDIQDAYKTFAIMSEYAPIAAKTSGKFSTEFDLKTSLDSEMMPVYETMNGGGEISTTPITIQGVNTLDKIADVLKYDKLKQLSLDKILLEFVFQDGKVIVEPFDMKMADLSATLSGWTSFDQSIDYTMALELPRNKLPSAANNALGNLVNQANEKGANFSLGDQVSLDVLIGGTLTDPTVSADLAKTGKNLVDDVKEKVKEVIEEKKEEISQAAKERADKILNDAEKQAQKIIQEAETQAENIRQNASQAAKKLKEEADKNASKVEEEGKKKGFLAEAAAKETAKKMRSEADNQAQNLIDEADQKADALVNKAKEEAKRVRNEAQQEANKILEDE